MPLIPLHPGFPGAPRTDPNARPANPYGMSKLITERMIRDTALAGNLGYVILRYFNVAGADPGGRLVYT